MTTSTGGLTVAKLAAVLLIGLLAAPMVVEAQPTRTWRIGVMTAMPRSPTSDLIQELRNLGYVEGRNVIIEWRNHEGDLERRSREALALMAWKPDVVVAVIAADGEILRQADARVPVVLGEAGTDLVRTGIVASLARPGGNITGIQLLQEDTAPKRLSVLKELMPRVKNIAVLHASSTISPAAANHNTRLLESLDATARTLSVRIRGFPVRADDDLDRIFAEMKRDADAVMVVTAPFIWVKRSQFSELALRYRLPTMHDSGGWTEDGGLVSYGPNTAAVWRRAAHFVDRILKGGKAADMPIEQPRNFELIINLKTAKALDLKIPQHLLLLADRIIE